LLHDLGRPDAGVLDDWLANIEDGYGINHDADALLWHAREVLRARRAKEDSGPGIHVAARPRTKQGVTELLVYAPDRRRLFASLSAANAAAGADIAYARVHTTNEGAAFDVFSFPSGAGRPYGLEDEDALENLIARVHRAALVDHAPPAPRTPSRRNAAFAIEPWVRIDNSLTPYATVIEASGRDRLGLLAELSSVFTESKATIVSAHIGAQGERVADVFYVTGDDGAQILDESVMDALRERLGAVLRSAEPEAPSDPANNPMAVARASTAR
jgi:[protein-PII] uridylyltransferase